MRVMYVEPFPGPCCSCNFAQRAQHAHQPRLPCLAQALTPCTATTAVLVLSFVMEGFSLLVATRAVLQGATAAGLTFWEYLKRGMDPTSVAVMLEDGAAVTGLIIAGAPSPQRDPSTYAHTQLSHSRKECRRSNRRHSDTAEFHPILGLHLSIWCRLSCPGLSFHFHIFVYIIVVILQHLVCTSSVPQLPLTAVLNTYQTDFLQNLIACST